MKSHRVIAWKGLLALALCALPACAGTLSFTGQFTTDDQEAVATFQIATARTVSITTFGWAGGTNAAGTQIAPGGFDPFLSLFDNAAPGLLLALNEDGGCTHVAADPVDHACLDSFLSVALPAGSYTVVLTQSGNQPFGPTLADGFLMAGMGNYTGGPFLSVYGDQRDGHWAFDIANVDAPEPGSLTTLFAGAVLLMLAARRRRP